VLLHEGRLYAASTAAGPAFEGARISCGMGAASGAIEKVVFDGDIRCGVIGNAPPIGLCGSGLIDLTAELLKHGIISPQGRLLPPEELPADLPDALRRKVAVDGDGRTEFQIASNGEFETTGNISLTQRDVREMQLATAAIRAGVNILLRRAELNASDLRLVLVAGGFGSFIRRSNAQRIGLLPPRLDHTLIHYVGNASLNGARWALVSVKARQLAEDLARQTRHIELSQDAGFQDEYAEAMIFPGG